MGSIQSLLSEYAGFESMIPTKNDLEEIFLITFLAGSGPTPYSIKLLPENNHVVGDMSERVRWALKKQKRFQKALLHESRPGPCLSPCLLKDFEIPEQPSVTRSQLYRERRQSRNSYNKIRATLSSQQRSSLGAFESLVLTPTASLDDSEEEIIKLSMIQSQKGPSLEVVEKDLSRSSSQRSRRARSRPETMLTSDHDGFSESRRSRYSKSKSAAHIDQNLSSIQEDPSEIMVETIQLDTNKNQYWPSRDTLKTIIRDKRTTVLMARFRGRPQSDFVEVEYRYNKFSKEESFNCKGSLKSLLNRNDVERLESDLANNNLMDEKTVFFQNFPYFFNNLEGRVWINGFLISIDGSSQTRMKLKKLETEPPAFVFDMSGLKTIKATKTMSRLSLHGTTGGDFTSRQLSVKGKNPESLRIIHEDESVYVGLIFPYLSALPVSKSKEKQIQHGKE